MKTAGRIRSIKPSPRRDTREDLTPVVDYGRMSKDELVDHFIDEGGLAAFLEVQHGGPLDEHSNWLLIARDLRAFCSYLTFSPAYLQDLYEMQKERKAE
jgi:hypothetical protein